MDEYIDTNEQGTTGDAYLDNFLEEAVEVAPVTTYAEDDEEINIPEEEEEDFSNPYSTSNLLNTILNEEEEVAYIEDEEAKRSFLEQFFDNSFDSSTAAEIRSNWGEEGVRNIAAQKFRNVHEEIVSKESGGDYRALPLRNGKLISSAVGKYQFLWNTWGPEIKRTTGVTSKEEFRNNPDAQDYYYNEVYVPNHVLPWVSQVKRHLRTNLSDEQLIKLYHFRGANDAMKYLQGQLEDTPESYNSPISKYTGITPGVRHLKTGGWIYAQTAIPKEEQEKILNSYSMNFTPIQPPVGITEEAYRVKGYNDNSPKLAGAAPLPQDPSGFDYNDAQKVADIAATAAGAGHTILGAANNIQDLKGKAMSTTLSAASAMSNDRLAKQREQAEMLRMYESLQNNFDDSTTDTLGQTRNIWDI